MTALIRGLSSLARSIRGSSGAGSITTDAARSVSDDGQYPEFCARASIDSAVFARFRSDSGYQRILEHVTPAQGEELLSIMESAQSPFLTPDLLARVAENDVVGAPGSLKTVGDSRISPTTLRYLKVATDINTYFDLDTVHDVTEIGVGYGGQVRVLDVLGIGRQYRMLDLAPVLALASRYLECFVLTGSYELSTINQLGTARSDLVLSMYALSELPRPLQVRYYEKVLKHSRAGFLIMNDCWDFDRLSRDEWVDVLGAETRSEVPETGKGNYVLLWGHTS